jgi:hypothetical protein
MQRPCCTHLEIFVDGEEVSHGGVLLQSIRVVHLEHLFEIKQFVRPRKLSELSKYRYVGPFLGAPNTGYHEAIEVRLRTNM